MLLEPIMKVEIECPEHFQGPITGDLISRRGMIVNTDMRDGITNIIAEVPLAETFGYATDIRSMSQGQGTFTMELAMLHARCPPASRKRSSPTRRSSSSARAVTWGRFSTCLTTTCLQDQTSTRFCRDLLQRLIPSSCCTACGTISPPVAESTSCPGRTGRACTLEISTRCLPSGTRVWNLPLRTNVLAVRDCPSTGKK